jgi:Methyltransferase domain
MNESCRLCGGATSVAFPMKVLGRHEVALYRCSACASLQVQQPFWLEEAYSSAIAVMDTGAVERNLVCQAGIALVAWVLGLKGRFLDFGGGTGLLCRLLRDRGHDAYVYDRYAEPEYARAFSVTSIDRESPAVDLLTAIEVFEHLDNPGTQIEELFAVRPKVLVATTVPYDEEGPDWWYLCPETGQHVFFYSRRALKEIAGRFGYVYFEAGPFHIFSRTRIGASRKAMLRCGLSRLGLRLGRVWIAATQRNRFADSDYRRLLKSAAASGSSSTSE